MSFPLEPDEQQMEALGRAALDFVIDHIGSLGEQHAAGEGDRDAVVRALTWTPGEEGGELDPALAEIRTAALSAFNTAGPGYLAYIPGGGLYSAAIADLISLGVNRYVGLRQPSPGLVRIEQDVLDWVRDLFGFPDTTRGVLTSGGSLANLGAVVAARHALLGEDFLDGVYYVTEQTHLSATKAAAIAGLPARAARRVPVTPGLRMDVDALAQMIRDDRAAGLRPFLVVGSAGTTNTGSVDPLDDLAGLAAREGLWFHVDGAYGGFFQLTDRGRAAFAGIERADSITLDPHKGMFLPYGTGCLIVRDGAALRSAHASSAAYLQDLEGPGDLPNYNEYSAELSRDWRGLRVWLPLKLHGVSAFREALDEKLDLARRFSDGVRELNDIEVPWEPDLSIVAFRHRDGDEASRALLESINAGGRVFISSTVIDGRFTLRCAVLSHRTHADRIDDAIEAVRRGA